MAQVNGLLSASQWRYLGLLVVGIGLLAALCRFWQDSVGYKTGILALQSYETAISSVADIAQHPCSTMFLWHKCLFSATHFHPAADQRDDSKTLDVNLLLTTLTHHISFGAKEPFRMYIQTSQLPVFFEHAWPSLVNEPATYVLVTGCSDYNLSHDGDQVLAALDHPKLLRWFAQNADLTHHKLTAIPIGIDFHTLVWHYYYWHTYRIMPAQQNTQLVELAEHARRHAQRQLAILVNFKVRGHDERSKATASIQRRLPARMIVRPGAEPRLNVWQQATTVEFVLSPPGVGKDCHRTWEALALGAIPIVLRDTPFDQVYKGYPVVVVDSWDEITESALRQWRETFRSQMQAMLAAPDRLLSSSFVREIMDVSAVQKKRI